MPLAMIKGTFRLAGTSPDGDSVRFYPDDPDAWRQAGMKVRVNAKGGVQLRLDGVDALEIHYRPRSANRQWRQPAELGDAAAAGLLEHLGFKKVTRDDDGTVTSADPPETNGYILTRFADIYGRPVCFAFRGSRRTKNDGKVWLDVTTARASANYQLLETGLAYPTFYSRLYPDIRDAMADAAIAARKAHDGVWADDVTLPGFNLQSRDELETEYVLLPKLFRRLVDYLALDNTGQVSLKRFDEYLATRDDRLFTVPEGHATGLDTLVEIHRQQVRLTVPPERIVFIEK